MQEFQLTAISPVDGRYQDKLTDLQPIFSEFGLIKFRVMIEIKWLLKLITTLKLGNLSQSTQTSLTEIIENFDIKDAERIKNIEATTNHDVKAVEYFLKEKFQNNRELDSISEFIHFGCTSEDINNLAYGLILQTARSQCLNPAIDEVIDNIKQLAQKYINQPMLSRTHGQPATPTTVGKEFANFAARLITQYQRISTTNIMGKFNGAVGNFNAHIVTYPKIDWLQISQEFVESLGLNWNKYTTQIEPHDHMAELFDAISRFNTILIDFARDIWGYIALGVFTQKAIATEIGSSTMPHKINPIDFENAEGNLGIANALLNHFSQKLPISRWQRDLSDSTVLRNIGVTFAHSVLAYKSIIKGLNKLEVNTTKIAQDLNDNWEVLAEAIQTVMRRYNILEPYEKLKALTRGKKITKETLHDFITTLELPEEVKQSLKQLTPYNYLGLASKLTADFL